MSARGCARCLNIALSPLYRINTLVVQNRHFLKHKNIEPRRTSPRVVIVAFIIKINNLRIYGRISLLRLWNPRKSVLMLLYLFGLTRLRHKAEPFNVLFL